MKLDDVLFAPLTIARARRALGYGRCHTCRKPDVLGRRVRVRGRNRFICDGCRRGDTDRRPL